MAERIYLDHISATPCAPQALAAALPFYENHFSQPTSPHQMGQELFSHINTSFSQLRDFFGATADDQLLFTSSGAEGISQVVQTACVEQFRKRGKNHFVARAIDEAPTVLALSNLEQEGCYLCLAPCSERGFVTKDALIDSISPRTAMVSLSSACALTGVIQPLDEIAEVCKQRAIWLHVDATHTVGKMPVNFSDMPCDFLTIDGLGVHAPVGTGLLLAKKEIPLSPLVFANPFNVAGFVALGYAAELSKDWQSLYCTEVCRLRGVLEQGLQQVYPEAKVLFVEEERLPHVTAIAFPGIHGELLAYVLNRKGVFACMGGGPFQQMERVLAASKVDPKLARTALSFSLSKDTQEHEIERAISIIGEATKRLGKLAKAFV